MNLPDFSAGVADLVTVRDLLRFGVSRFNAADIFHGHGLFGARAEADALVAHALNLPHRGLDAWLDARLTQDERRAVLALFERRIGERIPAAYLTGEAWLGDFRFAVDARVIVPRSFIAELLLAENEGGGTGLAPWIPDPEGVTRVLDLCTGSGCLAIIAAHCFPNAVVDAIDLSPDALAVARANVAAYQLEERVRLFEGDLYAPLPKGARYDLILTNPPYVNAGSMQALPAEYRHEPAMALAGGADGLDLVRPILAGAPARLNDGGSLVVEVGNERPHLEAAYPELPCTWLATSAGDDMVFLVERAALEPADRAPRRAQVKPRKTSRK